MTSLHKAHSNIDATTDVLTFDRGSSEDSIEADIAICSDEAKSTCNQRGHSLNEELLLYIVHGMLHCVGYDDHDEESHQKMHAEEDRILVAIGVGPVWSRNSMIAAIWISIAFLVIFSTWLAAIERHCNCPHHFHYSTSGKRAGIPRGVHGLCGSMKM